MNERYVLGEGYGLGKGILSDGENVGAFAWVGLTTEPGGAVVCPLTFPTISRVRDGVITQPQSRRKFRLVLEVIEDAEAEYDPTDDHVCTYCGRWVDSGLTVSESGDEMCASCRDRQERDREDDGEWNDAIGDMP